MTKLYRSLCLLALAGSCCLGARAQNVGIGTTTPTQTLDVNGALRVRGLSGSGTRLPTVQADGTLGTSAAYATPASAPLPTAAIGTANTGGRPAGVVVNGTTAYVLNSGDYSGSSLKVFDVSTPSAPVTRGTVTTVSNSDKVAVSGTMAYVINDDGLTQTSALQVIDVSVPTAPVVRSTLAMNSASGVAVSGSTVYVTNYGTNSLQVIDVSTPTAPVVRGTVTTGGGPSDVAVSGTLAYVTNSSSNSLQVIDVSTPAAPIVRGTVATGSQPFKVAVSSTMAYVLTASGSLQVIDVSRPTAPVVRGTVGTNTQPSGVAVSGTTVYVTNASSLGDPGSLQFFDVSAPTAPVSLGSVRTGFNPTSVAVSGTTAYVVASSDNLLQVFNFTPPRVVAINADGTLGSVSLPPSGPSAIQNTTTQQLGSSFNISGSGTIGGNATVGGNLRRSVRLCPVNQTATYALTATDVAYDQFKVANGSYAPTLVLPASGSGQVMGQELTIYSLADFSFTISGVNTDNGGSIPVQGASSAGVHAVKFVWDGRWIRVQ